VGVIYALSQSGSRCSFSKKATSDGQELDELLLADEYLSSLRTDLHSLTNLKQDVMTRELQTAALCTSWVSVLQINAAARGSLHAGVLSATRLGSRPSRGVSLRYLA
jgi:hypothetical protein